MLLRKLLGCEVVLYVNRSVVMLRLVPAAIVAIVASLYILRITSGVPLSDEWRWLEELFLPYVNGRISFIEYVRGEYGFLSHSHYLALLFMWLDYKWFDLDFSYFSYAGLLFYIFGLGLILKVGLIKQSDSFAGQYVGSSLIVAMSYCCLTSDFPWMLVVFEYVYFFMAIALLIAFDKYRVGNIRCPLFLFLLVAVFTFGDTIGMAAVFFVVFGLMILALMKRQYRRDFFIVMVAFVGLLVMQRWCWGVGVGVGGHSRHDTLLAILKAPSDILLSFFSIFSQPLVDMVNLKALFGENKYRIFQFALGLVGFQLVAWVSYCWMRERCYKQSWLPLLLIGFAALSWLLIFVSRYLDFGVYVIDAQRYVRSFTLIFVALGLMLYQLRPSKTAKFAMMLSACLVGGCFLFNSYIQLQSVKYLDAYFDGAKQELIQYSVGTGNLSNYIDRCGKDYCRDSIEFMREHKLSVFAK